MDNTSIHPGLLLNRLGVKLQIESHKRRDEGRRNSRRSSKIVTDSIKNAVLADTIAVFTSSKYRELYHEYLDDHLAYLNELKDAGHASLYVASTKSNLVVGVGQNGVMQTGIYLDYTYGVPMMPGTGVKGAILAAAVDREIMDSDDPAIIAGRAEIVAEVRNGGGLLPVRYEGLLSPEVRALFGSSEAVGQVEFLDAVPLKWVVPVRDTTTPHHSNYHGQKPGYEEAPDTENPIPVPSLAVPAGALYLFPVLHRSVDDGQKSRVEAYWRHACEFTGFGAHTCADDYGWFEPSEASVEAISAP